MSPSCSGSSRPGIPAERDRQTIRDLHAEIKEEFNGTGEDDDEIICMSTNRIYME